ncbi:hypothetical protein BDB01DRAFT_253935 [Pilobolus umbonatus]|nr:hypothetical protein BDB01DRAFT_253935 [Pilobolus umbonatus]
MVSIGDLKKDIGNNMYKYIHNEGGPGLMQRAVSGISLVRVKGQTEQINRLYRMDHRVMTVLKQLLRVYIYIYIYPMSTLSTDITI